MPRARHIEVQIIGDGSGRVSHLWERECSIQRRHQKLVEIAPAPALDAAVRERIIEAALRMASRRSLRQSRDVRVSGRHRARRRRHEFAFIEANPRLQVEHTVTEEVTGLDLVKLQIAARRRARR